MTQPENQEMFWLIFKEKISSFYGLPLNAHHLVKKNLSFLRDDVNFWLGKFSSDALLKFLCAIVARGNAVQKILNFPAKSLSIYLNIFFLTPLMIIK